MLTVPMVFRRVASLDAARDLAAGVLGWPELGEGLYDAGGAVVGFGVQAAEMGPEVCSRENLRPVHPGANPAEELRVAAGDFDAVARRAAAALGMPFARLAGAVRHDREGCSLSLYDATGNLVTLVRPLWRARAGRAGRRLSAILDSSPGAAERAVLAEVRLWVADVGRSLAFYRDLLGLPALRVTPREARLDAGPLLLTLQAEREVGAVADARRRGVLRDAVILRARSLAAEVGRLAAAGVEFPLGVEECRAARAKAFFHDPDGHRLVLWEPPRAAAPGTPAAAYLPVLQRIESRAAAAAAHSLEVP